MCSKKVKNSSKEVGASGVGEWLSNEVYTKQSNKCLEQVNDKPKLPPALCSTNKYEHYDKSNTISALVESFVM